MSNSKNIQDLLVEGVESLDLEIDGDGVSALSVYCSELLKWSRKINLIGKKQSLEQVVENHFLDSLLLLRSLGSTSCRLADIGSGAGFPGLVCKAVFPGLDLVLIEPRLKRVSFLRHIVRVLNLSSVEILPTRVAEVGQGVLPFSHITSRAVAEIVDFLEMTRYVANNESRIVCMKGPKWKEELERASEYLDSNDMVLEKTDELTLPFSGAKRAILVFRSSKK